MHIGIDARLPSVRIGGISEYTLNLIDALAGLGGDDRFTIVHARRDSRTYIPAGATHMTRADADTPCHHPMERLLLAAELVPHRLDVFHSPDFIPPSRGAARRVITIHDLGFVDHPDHFTASALRHYGGQIDWALAQADAMLTDSAFVRARLLERFDVRPERVTAVPLAAAPRYGMPPAPAQVEQVLARRGLTAGFVLFVGTLEPRKNLMTLVRAHDLMRRHGPGDVPLVIVGAAGWRCDDVLEAIAARPRSLVYPGVVSAAELHALYAAAGVLALPSIHEGFGLPVLEAMHSGCPVVASTGGALPEVAGDAALLLDPLDVGGWAGALAAVLGDASVREPLQAKGAARAAAFSWARTARATLGVYRQEP
jgi:glycosyltransferase involved in cell wall biosynthesis